MKRGGIDWLTLGVQFLAYLAVYFFVWLANIPLLLKLFLAFVLAIVLSYAAAVAVRKFRRRASQKRSEPRRIRVISVENVEDGR